jgi:hypothetical protein
MFVKIHIWSTACFGAVFERVDESGLAIWQRRFNANQACRSICVIAGEFATTKEAITS